MMRPARGEARGSKRMIASALCCAAFGFAAASRAESTFQPLGFLSEAVHTTSAAYAISADGSTVVGESANSDGNPEAFRWTAAEGMVGLGWIASGGGGSGAHAVSADGSVVVGDSDIRFWFGVQAFRWTAADGLLGLGYLPYGGGGQFQWSSSTSVSADGGIVVGMSTSPQNWQPFQWTAAAGMRPIPGVAGGYGDRIVVSGDGSVVAGDRPTDSKEFETYRWTESNGATSLGDPPEWTSSMMRGISADGSVIIETAVVSNTWRAYRWTAATGPVALPLLPTMTSCDANGVSADGSVIVGNCSGRGREHAVVWTASGQVRSLAALLAPRTAGWSQLNAYGVAADGRTIVGSGLDRAGNRQAWRAVVEDYDPVAICANEIDDDGDGLVDLEDPGCPFGEATSEDPPCDDGLDNDGDGLVDFADPMCQASWPYWETPPCGIGLELVAVIPLLLLLGRRRRAA